MVNNIVDIQQLDGTGAQVAGTYRVVARPARGTATSPQDYAVIVLEDGTEVFLEVFATPQAQRSEAERQRYNQRRVRVAGTIHRWMPNNGEGPMAPCISDVTSIVLLD